MAVELPEEFTGAPAARTPSHEHLKRRMSPGAAADQFETLDALAPSHGLLVSFRKGACADDGRPTLLVCELSMPSGVWRWASSARSRRADTPSGIAHCVALPLPRSARLAAVHVLGVEDGDGGERELRLLLATASDGNDGKRAYLARLLLERGGLNAELHAIDEGVLPRFAASVIPGSPALVCATRDGGVSALSAWWDGGGDGGGGGGDDDDGETVGEVKAWRAARVPLARPSAGSRDIRAAASLPEHGALVVTGADDDGATHIDFIAALADGAPRRSWAAPRRSGADGGVAGAAGDGGLAADAAAAARATRPSSGAARTRSLRSRPYQARAATLRLCSAADVCACGSLTRCGLTHRCTPGARAGALLASSRPTRSGVDGNASDAPASSEWGTWWRCVCRGEGGLAETAAAEWSESCERGHRRGGGRVQRLEAAKEAVTRW